MWNLNWFKSLVVRIPAENVFGFVKDDLVVAVLDDELDILAVVEDDVVFASFDELECVNVILKEKQINTII
jgi:hypothetical protein|tara:strand:+ start:239 stop:451 length:213 start_codon:yes stop_codon:yes gene_type:complete